MECFYNKPKEEVLDYFNVGYNGLTAKQVDENIKKHGRNEIQEKKPKSKTRIFFEQLQDLLVIILIIAAILSLFTGEIESTIVIFTVIILNAFLGTYQHVKAEKSLKSLKKLSALKARVIREGQEFEIPSVDITIGDIVIVKAGDIICADGRIIYNEGIEVNESSLTGESLAVEKLDIIINEDNTVLGDQKNMLFSGSIVSAGKGLMVITRIGMNTELGKIAKLLEVSSVHKSPLQISMDEFSKQLAIWIISICIVIFGISLYRNIALVDALMFAIALAVAAIPEALSSIVTIVLAIGTQRMVEENAIVKELKAVESLGCINIICSDKTGTLTQNKMLVDKIYIVNQVVPANTIDINNKYIQYLLMCCYLCNDSVFVKKEYANGTELALLDYTKSLNINVFNNIDKYPRYSVIPFDANRKMMSTLNKVEGEMIIFGKGAVEVILGKSQYLIEEDKKRRITTSDRYDIKTKNNTITKKGYRTIGFAYRNYQVRVSDVQITFSDEENLVFLGFAAIIDPPRPEAKLAITSVIMAGIKPIMITGDHQNTALAIAMKLGIATKEDKMLTGKDIDLMNEEELYENIKNTTVFARVSPEHKIKIVQMWQKHHAIVAFVGDGVNDAPAIKEANIGIAMGKGGTEVSKEASAIILTDDNYYTIIKAVKNGRKIYNNIQNSIKFLLSGNAAGLLTVLYTSLLSLPIPFAPVHLLFINLLTDSLPAIAIGMEENEEDLMKKPPRKTNAPLISKRIMLNIIFEGILIGIFTVLSYYIGLTTNHYVARTCAFGTLCIARLFHSFNCRGNKLLFKNKVKNKVMIFSFILGIILINVVLFVPSLQSVFDTYLLTKRQIVFMYLFAILPTFIIQVLLLIHQKRKSTIFNQ